VSGLSHINQAGEAHMVDVSQKPPMLRQASAEGFILMAAATVEAIQSATLKKGDALATARIAGIQAAKQTASLIPLCHPLALSKIAVEFEWTDRGLKILGSVACTGSTGVEMEALTAVSVAALTLYDMGKAIDKSMVIEGIRLTDKTKTALP
jgi:cyclic pyranopterin phosphate synthase